VWKETEAVAVAVSERIVAVAVVVEVTKAAVTVSWLQNFGVDLLTRRTYIIIN